MEAGSPRYVPGTTLPLASTLHRVGQKGTLLGLLNGIHCGGAITKMRTLVCLVFSLFLLSFPDILLY